MLGAGPQLQAAPFDGAADGYDEVFTTSSIGQAQRNSVWEELDRAFHPGQRVLEIGCGTGVDACYLAERGVCVVACDNSPRMIAVASQRLTNHRQAGLVELQLLPAENIATLQNGDLFDGAFSNFGALNCVRDMRSLAQDMASLLRPGATALLCLMGSCCLWEVFWYLSQGNPEKAFRRRRDEGSIARLSGGGLLRVYYPSVRSLASAFSPEFTLEAVKGIGVAVPPSYVESTANRFPGLLRAAAAADLFLGRCPGVRVFADHVLFQFRRKGPEVVSAG